MFLPDANGRIDNASPFPVYPSNIDTGKFLFLLHKFLHFFMKKTFSKI